ncbi:MAG: DUF928 domain-containing protein [Cyanobacteria bacterium P01_A01_bin.83]
MFKAQSLIEKLFIVIYVFLMLERSLFAESKTQPTKNDSDSEEKIVFIDEFDPPGDDKPKDTGAGGSRDGLRCNPNEQPIHAIMPPGNFGLTTKVKPNIYLYLPQNSAKQVVLAIQNENKTIYERAFLPIETNNNIASFSLPKNKLNLEADKNYQWKISVICSEHPKPGDPTFTGWIQRVEPTAIQKQLNNKTNQERIQYFAENGYWYDLLDAVASQNNWQQILEIF